MVDVSKIQVGDELTIRVIVKSSEPPFDQHSRWTFRAKMPAGLDVVSVCDADIVTHTPKPREIKVGDSVAWEHSKLTWTVMALDGAVAWLKSESVYTQLPVEKLQHA